MSGFAVHANCLSSAAVVLGVAAVALGAPALASTETSARRPAHAGAFVQQGRKLLPADPSELSHFAGTVALSGDGNTALIGAPGEGPGDSPARRGAAFMYARSSRGTWRRVGTLRADDQTPDAAFGSAVALSADGNTALITGAGDTEGIGAAWIFTRSHGRWKQQRPKLNGVGLDLGTGSGATGFGISAALSANGNTALVGAYLDGSAFVFVRSHGQWSQQGPKIAGVDAENVALSDDGNRALIRNGTEADLFTRSPSGVWALSSRLTVCPCPAGQGQADDVSLALSGDGKTAILGDSGFNISTGAAFVFARSPRGRWTRRVRLTVTGAEGFNPYVGNSVGLSRDGRTALIGAESDLSGVGAAWVFRRAGGRWSQQGHKLTARDESGPGAGNFASSLALSGDASTALIGGSSERMGAGAAWVFAARRSTRAAAASTSAPTRTWMNVSGCAVPAGGPYSRPVWAQHPSTVGLTCNGTAALVGVRWLHWAGPTARASATLVLTTCTPSCATGPSHRHAATVVASNIKVCGHRHVYGTVTIRWTDAGHRRTSPGPVQGCL